MSKTAHVLSSILERSGIDRKLGHPLYLYRITSNELASLREALLSAVENQGELKWPEDCAAFCLFGAEWFRHNYEDGVWSWDTIYSGLGWREHAIERLKPNVTKIVAKGLKWWGLEVIRLELSRRFLATLVCQGGLPIHSLRRDGGSLARFLKASLRVHERYSSVPIVQVIEEQAYILPLSFQNPDFLNLAGRLIDTVSKLRALSDRYSESGVSRKEYLDRNQPDWALSLPLRIEESESLSLVVSLLDESKAKLIPDGQFAISTRLEQPETLARLVREVEFPSVLTPDELRRHFLVDPSIELYPRLLVFLNCGGKQTPCLSVVLNRDGASYRLAKQERTSTSISGATDFIRLVLKFSGEEIGQCVPVGSDEMPDSPWTFTDREPNPLIGIGGVKSRENSVLIALPAENTLEVITGQHSFLETLVHGRRIVRLSGESVVRSIDGICRIISKSIDINSAIFELRGKQLRLGESHEYVWIGAPTIDEILLDENGNRRSVPEFQMEWRPQRNSGWRRLSGACLGDVVLRVVSNGEVKFLCRTKVFPSDFTLSIKPDVNSASSGRIELRNLGSASIDFENSNDVITTVAFAGRLHCVSVKVHG